MSPKSLDPRDRPVPVRLPIEVEIFYVVQGALLRECAKSRAMEQFLIARATAPENIQETAKVVRVRAKLQGLTPMTVLRDVLEEAGYGEFMDLDDAAEACCLAWDINPLEGSTSSGP